MSCHMWTCVKGSGAVWSCRYAKNILYIIFVKQKSWKRNPLFSCCYVLMSGDRWWEKFLFNDKTKSVENGTSSVKSQSINRMHGHNCPLVCGACDKLAKGERMQA
jgi:hypothetical protein